MAVAIPDSARSEIGSADSRRYPADCPFDRSLVGETMVHYLSQVLGTPGDTSKERS